MSKKPAKEQFGEGFGNRLAQLRREKAIRDRRDVSQAEIAKALGIPPTTYSRLESGVFKRSPEMETLRKIADYFGVSLGWLWFGEGTHNAPTVIREAEAERDLTAPSTAARAAGRGRNK